MTRIPPRSTTTTTPPTPPRRATSTSDTVRPFLGERLTYLFAHAVSTETDCLICSTFLPAAPGRVGRESRRARL
jgi:hypothetical protein